MTRCVLAALSGGIVVFAWGAVWWMLLPWQEATLGAFRHEAAMVEVLRAQAPDPGVYLLPNTHAHGAGTGHTIQQEAVARMQEGPFMFAAIRPHGVDPQNPWLYVRSLLAQILGAFLVGLILLRMPGSSYRTRVGVVVLTALIAGLLGVFPQWNWWGFSLAYVGLDMVDLVIGWFLAGLVMARLLSTRPS